MRTKLICFIAIVFLWALLAQFVIMRNRWSDKKAYGIFKMTAATHKNLYHKVGAVFISGKDKQVSYASQAWMVLSGVASVNESKKAFKNLLSLQNVIYPGAPYLYHYVIEAMIKCGMKQEAKELLVRYWGDMVKKGADTFWEVYDPKNDFLFLIIFFLLIVIAMPGVAHPYIL